MRRGRQTFEALRDWSRRTGRRLRGRWASLRERFTAAGPRFRRDDWAKRFSVGEGREGPKFLKGVFGPKRLALAAASNGLTALAVAVFGVFVLYAPRLPGDVDLWDANRPPSLVILDRNGEELASRGSDYGETVAIEDLPQDLIDAVLATEDRRFYTHGGIDPRGLARAFVVNVRSGAIVQGGSTITQQLAKNAFLSAEQTATRKAKEALLAIWIEGRYEKDEILSVYLNRIYLGAGAYGVDAASRIYFGKSARDLTLAEAAVIAALPKAPSTLAPTTNPEGAYRRAAEVLDNMVEDGRLDRETAELAKAEPAEVVDGAKDAVYGYFIDYVTAKLRDRADITLSDDLVVKTTLDKRLQAAAEAAVVSVIEADGEAGGFSQGALIAYATDGGVLAVVGGKSYTESQFNRATQALRQPGSAFKPFVYLAALERGMTPRTLFLDAPIEVEGWRPSNYSNTYVGPVRLVEAMERSINTVSVQVSEAVGRDRVLTTARALGVESEMYEHPSLALGAFATTLEILTSAYIPFATRGLGAEPHVLVSVETRDGAPIYAFEPAEPQLLFSAAYADDITHMMHQVMDRGTGRRADIGGGRAVGKTGTTNDWRDAWFVGYSASVVAGAWVGEDDYAPMNQVTGGDAPARIWNAFMAEAASLERFPELPGHYPTLRFAEEQALAGFYDTLAVDFREEEADGSRRLRIFGGRD
ncbi:MAG: PBP1A family penicillin-binding protein [Pseudomonadota bacterium]